MKAGDSSPIRESAILQSAACLWSVPHCIRTKIKIGRNIEWDYDACSQNISVLMRQYQKGETDGGQDIDTDYVSFM